MEKQSPKVTFYGIPYCPERGGGERRTVFYDGLREDKSRCQVDA